MPQRFYGENAPNKIFFEIYHGYGAVNKDGTRVLCKQNQKCKFASNKPFRKLPQHVNFQIQTRTETIKYQEQRIASTRYVNEYFQPINP